MLDKIQKRRLNLKAEQDADTPMHCPRCGANNMKQPLSTNALSRIADVYICDSCGTAEGLLAMMRHSYPLHRWHVFQPQKPESDFKARPTKDVLAEVLQTQIDTLEHTSLPWRLTLVPTSTPGARETASSICCTPTQETAKARSRRSA